MTDGGYLQQVYIQKEGELQRLDDIQPRAMGGSALESIPLVCIGSVDTSPECDSIPLLGIAELALSIYQQYADYRQSLYMTSQPTAVVSGIMKDQAPDMIGASTIWTLEPPEARAYFLEFGGAGIASQRQAMQDEMTEAAAMGAQMLEASKRAAESGEALRMRHGAATASLLSIMNAIESGLVQALGYIADWLGVDRAGISIELNRDFIEESLDPQQLQALVASWQAQAISQEVLFHNLRKMEVIPPQTTDEELRAQIETEGPALIEADSEDDSKQVTEPETEDA